MRISYSSRLFPFYEYTIDSIMRTLSSSCQLLTARAFHRILREPRPHLYGYEETEDFRSLWVKRVVIKRVWIHSLSERGARSSFSRFVRCSAAHVLCYVFIDPRVCTMCLRGVYLHTGSAINDDTRIEKISSLHRNVAVARNRESLVWMLM